jgi:hypothetical protein
MRRLLYAVKTISVQEDLNGYVLSLNYSGPLTGHGVNCYGLVNDSMMSGEVILGFGMQMIDKWHRLKSRQLSVWTNPYEVDYE